MKTQFLLYQTIAARIIVTAANNRSRLLRNAPIFRYLMIFLIIILVGGSNMELNAQSFSATLSSNQKFAKPLPASYACGGHFGSFTSINASSTLFSYATQAFTVSSAGNYTIEVTSSSAYDPMLYIYTSFNPSSPNSNFKVGDDDSGAGLLSKIGGCGNNFPVGTYVIVVTAYSSTTTSGTVNFTISGAGTTIVMPSVTTNSASSPTSTSVTLGGNVTATGGATVTARGVAWGTSSNPTSGTAMGSGTGAFSQTVSGLTPGTTYFARAYATNSVGTNYGPQVSFTTQNFTPPSVTTNNTSGISTTSATFNGNVTNTGGQNVSRGFQYSTNSSFSGAITRTLGGNQGTGAFSFNETSLSGSTLYYVRAWASNSGGTTYGSSTSFYTNHTVTYSANANGSITGSTTQYISHNGSTSSVTAVPVSGFHFLRWSDNSTANPRTDVNVTSSFSRSATFDVNRLEFTSQPTNTIAGAGINFTVRIRDSYGNTMTNSDRIITVALASNPAGGTLAGTLTSTAVNGVAAFTLPYIQKTGVYTVTVSASGLTSATSNSFTIIPAALSYFTLDNIVSPHEAGTFTSPRVIAYDLYDNVKTNYTGTVVFSTNNVSLNIQQPTVVPANYTFLLSDNGIKTFTNQVNLKQYGTGYYVRVNDGTAQGEQTNIQVASAPLHYYTLAANPDANDEQQDVLAGTAFTVIAKLFDEFENQRLDFNGALNVSFTSNATPSPLGNPAEIPAAGNRTFTAGVATVGGFTFYNAMETPTITITEALTGSAGTTPTITVWPEVLDNFLVEEVPNQTHTIGGVRVTASDDFSVKVTARDQYNNTKRDYVGHINFKASNDVIVDYPNGLQAFTSVHQGVRTFTDDINIPLTGRYWLRVADSPEAFKTGELQNIVVGPGVQHAGNSELYFTSHHPSVITYPSTPAVVAGDYISVTIKPRDAGTNLLCDCQTMVVMLNGANEHRTGAPVNGVPAMQPIIVTDNHDGSYTAQVRVTNMGITNQITASVNGTTISVTLNVTVNAPSVPSLATTTITADPTAIIADNFSTITVQLKDQFENNRTTNDGTVTLSVGGLGNGIIVQASASMDADYVATYFNNGQYRSFFKMNGIGLGIATITGAFNDGDAINGNIVDDATVDVTHGLATQLAINTQPAVTSAIAGIAFTGQPVIHINDQWGNHVTTGAGSILAVSAAKETGTDVLKGTLAATASAGVATFTNLNYETAETQVSIMFTAPGVTQILSGEFTVVHNIPDYLVIENIDQNAAFVDGRYNFTAGISQNIKITAYDTYGNLADRFTGNRDLTFSGAFPSPNPGEIPKVNATNFPNATTLAFVNGSVTAALTLYKEELAQIAANHTAAYIDSYVNGNINIDAADDDRLPVRVSQNVPSYFAVTIAGNLGEVTAGQAYTITVSAFDAFNNPATFYTGNKELVFTGAGVSPAPSTSPTIGGVVIGNNIELVFNNNGQATATMILYKAETGISITVAESSGINPVQTGGEPYDLDLDVNHGAANYFAVTGTPGAMTAGTTQTVTVTAYDTWNNLATGYAGDKEIVFSGAIPSPDNLPATGTAPTLTDKDATAVAFGNNTNMTFTAGVATGTMALYKEENVNIVATQDAITTPAITGYDYRLAVNVGHAAANYFAVTGTTATMTAGGNQTITVTLYDQFNNIATTYNGAKDLTFSGANVSELNNEPTVATVDFGETTSLTFTNGIASGTMFLYKAENAAIKVSNGSQNTSNSFDFEVTVNPNVAHNLAITTEPAHSTTEAIAGVAFSTQPVVRIRDVYGNLVVSDNTTEIASATGSTGTASLFGTLTATASGGIATFSGLNYQKAENMNILFSSGSLQTVTSNTLTVVHNVPTYMAITGAGIQTAGESQTITVTAYDAYENVAIRFAGNKSLTFSGAGVSPVPSTSPTVAATAFGNVTSLNFGAGVATGSMILYKEETAYIEATHADAAFTDSYTGATNLNIAAANPNGLQVVVGQAAPAYFAISGNGTQTAGTSQNITINAYDAFNNLATNYNGSKLLRFSGASPSLAPSTNPTVSASDFGLNTAITFNNGVASGDMYLYKSEEAEILATEILGGTAGNPDGTTGITTRVDIPGYVYHLTVEVSPNDAHYFAVTGNGTQIAGASQPITVTAYDQWNNVATGYTESQSITFSGASDSPNSPKAAVSPKVDGTSFGTATSLTFTAGVATGSMILTKVEIASVKATQGSIVTPTAYALGVEVSHAVNNYFAVTGSSTQTAGEAQTITVTMYDAYNNIATSYDGSKTLIFDGAVASLYNNIPTVNSANFGSATTVAFSNGIANTASMILTNAVSTTVTASGDGINTATGLGLTVNVGHNIAHNLRIDTQPSAYVRAGDVLAQQPVISIRDAYGNLVDDDATQITASANGNSQLTGIRTLTAVDGVVSFSGLNYRLMETITIGFTSSPALTGRTSDNVVVDHNATYEFEFTTVPEFIIAGGQRGAYVVNRYDAYNNLVNNVVNQDGSDNTIAETVYLFTSMNGAPVVGTFHNALIAGSPITTMDIANNATSANFWYYSQVAGDHLITGSDVTPLDNPDTGVINATHNTLEVRPAALSHFIVSGIGTDAPHLGAGWTEHYYGDVQTVTVEAIDILGNRKTNYTGRITFNLTDAQAAVGTNYPVDYTFTAGDEAGLDNGIHTFTNSILFTRPSFEHPSYPTVNEWWVTAVDQAQPTKFGSQVKIKVLARPITILANNQIKQYYGDIHNLGTTAFTVSGLTNIYANNESVTSVTLTSTGTVATALAGDHPIIPSNATGIIGFNPDYYNITYSNGILDVEKRPITIAVNPYQNKVYSLVDPIFNYQITSTAPFNALVNGDVFDGLLTRQAGENVANNYLISQGGLTIVNSGVNKEANYNITFVNANFEITPWPLVLSSFSASDKTYDATTTAALTFNNNRPHAGDEIIFSTTANFVDRHVNWTTSAQAKEVYFEITISGGTEADNYIISSASPNTSGDTYSWIGMTTATINQRPINVTAQAVSRIYDGTTNSYNNDGSVLPIVQTSQLVGTDAISNVGVQTYNNANVGESKPLTPSGTVINDANNGDNYAIAYVAQNLGEITKREITVAITGNPIRVYNATNAATLVAGDYTIGNLVTDESMTINQTSGIYNSVNVGTSPDRTVSVSLAETNYDAGGGTLLSNYTLPGSATGDGTITPYPITLSNFAAANKTYDGTTPTTITFNHDVIGTDDVTFGYTANFSDRNVNWASSAAQTKTVSYAVSISGGAQAGNYMFDEPVANTGSATSWQGTTTATINQRPITVAVTAGQNKTYGDNDPASYTATVTGLAPLLGTDDQISGTVDARVLGENVGNYAIERGSWKIIYPAGSNADMEDNYAITFTPADFAITRLDIALTPNAGQDKIYGQADPLPFTYTTVPVIGTTLANGIQVALSGALTRDAGEVVNFYNILQGTVTNATNGNYNITFTPEVKFEIERKAIVINVTSNQNKEYGDGNPTYTYSTTPAVGDLPFSADFIGALVRDAGENVAIDYTIMQGSLELGDDNNTTTSLAQNYTVTFNSADFAITRKAIAITVTANQEKVYGQADPVFAFTTVPELASLPFQAASWTGALVRQTGEVVANDYTITQGSLELIDGQNPGGSSLANNYTVTFTEADFEITRKPITITVDAGIAKIYGDNDPAFTFTSSPALASLPFIAEWVGNLVRLDGNNNVSAYAITQGSLELKDANNTTASLAQNYTLNFEGNDLTINKRDITLTVIADQYKVYAETDPVFAYSSSISPLYYNGNFTGALTRALGENVADNYAIGRGTLQVVDDNNGTSLDANYNLNFVAANFEITKKPITITVVAGQNKRYGFADPTSSPAAPTFFRDFEFVSSVDPLPFSGNFIGSLVRTGVSSSPVNTYPINRGTLNINDVNNNTTSLDANYQITFAGSNFTINERLLTLITTDQTKTYGFGPEWGVANENYWTLGSTAFTVSGNAGDGMAYSETISGVAFNSSGEQRYAHVGTYPIAINSGSEVETGGFLKSNYDISYVNGELDITPRTLNLWNFAADNKVYDGTVTATGLGFFDNRVNGDNLAFTRTAIFDNKDAGTAKVVTYNLVEISGGTDKDNYVLETETSHWKTAANREITPKQLTITADYITKYFGDVFIFLGNEFTTNPAMVVGESIQSATLTSDGAAAGAEINTYPIVISTPVAGNNTLLANYNISLVNGTMNVIDPQTILGKVYYYKKFSFVGGIPQRVDEPMAGVEVKLYNLSNNLLGTALTNSQGIYQFNLIAPGSVSKIEVGTSLPWGSVSANDALAMQLKIVQSPPTYWQSPFNIDFMNYIADIDTSGTLTIQDVLGTKFRILNPSSFTFPAGNWRFYAEGSPFAPLAYETDNSASLASPVMDGNNYYPNIYARVVGDMDGDYNPNPSRELIPIQEGEAVNVTNQEWFSFDVRLRDALDFSAMSLTLIYDDSKVEVASLLSNLPQSDYVIDGNEIRIVWTSLDGIEMEAEEVLMTLQMRTIAPVHWHDDIIHMHPGTVFGNAFAEAIAGVEVVAPRIENELTNIIDFDTEKLSISAYPNPFLDWVTFAYDLPANARVNISLVNVMGVTIRDLVDEHHLRGTYTYRYNAKHDNLGMGVYYLRLTVTTNGNAYSRILRIVHIE